MEDILNNIISASKIKADEDVENTEELVKLFDNLANFMKDLNPDEVKRRILSTEILKALNSFESARVREYSAEIVEKCLSFDAVNTQEYFSTSLFVLSTGYFEKVVLQKLLKDVTEFKFIIPKEIVMKLVALLLSNNTSIASPAETLLIKTYEQEDLNGSRDLTAQLFTKLTSSNAEQACRILEVAVQVSLKSNEHLRQMEEIMKFCLTNQQFMDDILYQMNMLEILQNLLIVDYGFEYLERNGILKHFGEQIMSPEKALLSPGIMRFFTHAALTNPRKILSEYSSLVELLFATIRDGDFQVVTLETLGQIFLTNDSKKILHERYDGMCCETLKTLFASISNYPSDFKSRVFECLEKVFTIDDITNVNNQITYICERWFLNSKITFGALLNYCKQPFQDISLSSLRLVHALISHGFGRNALKQTGGFIEYLLDRNCISSYDIALIKFQIITKLSSATEFDVATITKFNDYVRQGLYSNDQNATAVCYE